MKASREEFLQFQETVMENFLHSPMTRACQRIDFKDYSEYVDELKEAFRSIGLNVKIGLNFGISVEVLSENLCNI